jgi:iron(III) transport system permease protein
MPAAIAPRGVCRSARVPASAPNLADAGLGWAPAVGLGTGAALVIAYTLRFLTISVGATEAGLARIPSTLPDAARMLGRRGACSASRH